MTHSLPKPSNRLSYLQFFWSYLKAWLCCTRDKMPIQSEYLANDIWTLNQLPSKSLGIQVESSIQVDRRTHWRTHRINSHQCSLGVSPQEAEYLLSSLSGSCLRSPYPDAVAARLSAFVTTLYCHHVQDFVFFVSCLFLASILRQLKIKSTPDMLDTIKRLNP